MKDIRWTYLLILSNFAAFVGLCNCKGNLGTSLDLFNYLLNLSRYNPSIIPTCGNEKRVTVEIGMALGDIVEIWEKQQLIRLKIWVRLKWRDCMLQWNSSQFQNQTELIVPYSKIWIPDITLYEGVSDEGNMPDMEDYRASISHTGDVTYNFPSIVTVVCRFNVAYFPFDHQICSMKFGSWMYSGKNIDLNSTGKEVDISSFRTHNEWDVVDSAAVRHNIYYGCCPDPYPDVTFHIHIRRKPFFYVVTIIFPCILINMLSFLGFVLPPFSGEKISLQVTVLLSITVFLLLVQDKFPSAAENFPLLAMYFSLCMVLVCVSCVLSSIVLHVYNRSPNDHHISPFIRSVFLDKFRQIMCIKSDMVLKNDELVQISEIRCLKTRQDLRQQQCMELHKGERTKDCVKLSLGKGGIPEYSPERSDHSFLDHRKCHITNEWELFAFVLDRFFMLIYLCLTLGNSIVFILIMGNYEGNDIPME
ncbi:acetylcholine receptor subunit alpha-1-B-like [Saccostrea echinata]|uniref:acetylcholine receptor subunit alpha-1-B-like n=1 Tax=Saccostrea echinata TaxID=191078 RepID=UPI002A830F96|nr:acetylcholine receptor subunit alpha-1-B-like [Saccostrea echinata]